jgi:ComEC/Rec2-related protein
MSEQHLSTELALEPESNVPVRQPMPTPLLLPAVSFAIGVALADRLAVGGLDFGYGRLGLTLCTVCGMLLLIWRLPRGWCWVPLSLGVLLCGGLRMLVAQSYPADHIKHVVGQDPVPARLTGVVASTPRTVQGVLKNPFYPRRPETSVRFLMSVHSADRGTEQVTQSGLVQVTVRPGVSVPATVGDPVTVTGWLQAIQRPLNPGGFDWQDYQVRRGVFAELRCNSHEYVRVMSPESASMLIRWQNWIRSAARRMLYGDAASDETRELLDVLILGQRSAAGKELNERFIRLGAAPFLAVSGFHVGILALSVAFLGRLVLSRERTAWLVLIVLAIYLLVVEPNPPVLRASLMGMLASLAVILRRPFATLNWWAGASLILLMINPQMLFDVGFQLTFALVLVLLTFWPTFGVWSGHLLRNDWDFEARHEAMTYCGFYWSRAWRGILAAGCLSLMLSIASAPLAALYFGRIGLWGVLGNLLVGPVVVLTLWLSLLGSLLNALLGVIGIPGPDLAEWSAVLLLAWTGWLDQLIGVTVETSRVPWMLVLISYAPLCLTPLLRQNWIERRLGILRPRRLPTSAVLAVLLLPSVVLWSAWALQPVRSSQPGIDILAMYRGCGSVLQTGDSAVLLDGGTLGNWDASIAIRQHLKTVDSGPVSGAILTGQTAGYFSAWKGLVERSWLRWVDPEPMEAIDSASARRLWREIQEVPKRSIQDLDLPGTVTIQSWQAASGNRGLLLDFGGSGVIYAPALMPEELLAMSAAMNREHAIRAWIVPQRGLTRLGLVLNQAREQGVRIVVVQIPADEPAAQRAQEWAGEGVSVYNVLVSGAVRLLPDLRSPAGFEIRPLTP